MKQILKNLIAYILEIEARLVLNKYKPKIIVVTGTVGKTSSKEAIYAILSKFFFVRKSEKSYNTELGVPLTILGVPNAWSNPFLWFKNILDGLSLIINREHYPEWLVLEVGADREGDIKRIVGWLYPDINVITRFADIPVHVEYFSSPNAVNEEDSLFTDILPPDGFLILNADDPKISELKSSAKVRVISYGFGADSTIVGSNPGLTYKGEGEEKKIEGVTFKVDYDGASVPVRIAGVLGKSPMYSALAALSVGKALGLNTITMIEALSSYETPQGRLRIIKGVKETTIIDDTYNASPIATEVALSALEEVDTEGRRIAMLGDMLELGKYSVAEHKRIGEIAGKVVDILVTVGIRSRDLAEGALNAGLSEKNIFQFEDSREAGKFIEKELKKGDVVLVKGSQSIRMERAVEEIMAHPEDKKKILCRQDEEWQSR